MLVIIVSALLLSSDYICAHFFSIICILLFPDWLKHICMTSSSKYAGDATDPVLKALIIRGKFLLRSWGREAESLVDIPAVIIGELENTTVPDCISVVACPFADSAPSGTVLDIVSSNCILEVGDQVSGSDDDVPISKHDAPGSRGRCSSKHLCTEIAPRHIAAAKSCTKPHTKRRKKAW